MQASTYRQNFEHRAAEIEAQAGGHSAYADTYRAASYKEMALQFSALADTENRERRREQADAKTIGHALSILETIDANLLTDGAIACLVDYLHAKLIDRDTPVAWAGTGLHMERTVSSLSQLLAAACHNDGIVFADAAESRPCAEELRLFEHTEARAINAGAA